MNKVELAKMIGLHCGYTVEVYDWQIISLIERSYEVIEEEFCNGKIKVTVEQEDLAKHKLDIEMEDLVREEDAKVCCKQVEDLLWERAADEYLARVHNAAMVIGN